MQQALHLETISASRLLPSPHDTEKRQEAHLVELIPHTPVVIDETGHLLLQPIILLHQQLIHRA
jgi:hypothetical protein